MGASNSAPAGATGRPVAPKVCVLGVGWPCGGAGAAEGAAQGARAAAAPLCDGWGPLAVRTRLHAVVEGCFRPNQPCAVRLCACGLPFPCFAHMFLWIVFADCVLGNALCVLSAERAPAPLTPPFSPCFGPPRVFLP